MALPVGITTCTVTVGPAYSYAGEEGVITGTVVADRNVVWAATGAPVFKTEYQVTPSSVGGQASFVVPHVNQSGFINQSGDAITGWYYTFTGRATFDGNRFETITKRFQVVVGQTNVDLDLVPDGPVIPGVTTPTATVTSVAGLTGVVTQEQLEALGLGGSAPAGGFKVFATEDEAVADAHPEFAWVILAPVDSTAPATPTGLSATPGDGQVALSWTAATDAVGVTGYKVRRGGTVVATPTGTTYTDTGRTNGTTYSYTVSAVDAAGNESAQTSAVTATPDTTAILRDTFNRADSSTLGNAETGQTWVTGFGTSVIGIAGNRAIITTDNGDTNKAANIGTTAHDVTAIAGSTGGTLAGQAVYVRQTDGGNWVRARTESGPTIELEKFVGSTYTKVATYTAAGSTNPETLRVTAVGNVFTVYVNGTQVGQATITDSVLQTGQMIGFGLNGTTPYIDNIVAV